jgi:hypothetical protein
MTASATMEAVSPVRGEPVIGSASRPRVAWRTGERAALVTAAVAVAALPLLVPHGPGNVAPADLFIVAALGACLTWAGASRHSFAFPYAIAMWVFMVGGAIGALAGPVPWSGALALIQDLELLAWCWIVANIASSPARLRILVNSWAYSAVGWAALLTIGLITRAHFLTGQTGSEGSRTALTFFDPNYAANYWFISIMIIWATGVPRRRWLRVVGYCLLVTALLSTGSNSGMVALIVGTAVAATFGTWRRHGQMAAVAAAALLAIGGWFVTSHVSITQIQHWAHGSRYAVIRDGLGRGQASVRERTSILHESIHLYRTGSPLGAGPVSTEVRLKDSMAPYVKEAHDDYFAAVLERGVIGAFGLLLLLGSVATRTFWVGNGRIGGTFAQALVRPHALAGAVAGTLAAETVYELLHVRHVWALYGLVAAICLGSRR